MTKNTFIKKTEGLSKYVTPSMKVVQMRIYSSILANSIKQGPEKYEQNSWDLDDED